MVCMGPHGAVTVFIQVFIHTDKAAIDADDECVLICESARRTNSDCFPFAVPVSVAVVGRR